MKKIVVLLVVAGFLAAPAFGATTISGTKHDLSSGSNTDEICVFCHTPHGSTEGVKPLWNRTVAADLTAADLYNSITLSTASDPNGSNSAAIVASVNKSDAKLCLSCHDGTTQLASVTNPPNALNGVAMTVSSSFVGGVITDTNAVIGTTLTNDHPIGMNYNAAVLADTTANLNAQPLTGVQFFGAAGGDMWCSSCHDVHNNTNAPFLTKTNASSGLCTTCHNK